MKTILIHTLFVFLLTSCSLKEAYDNGFETKSEITPLAPADKLAKRFGDGKYVNFKFKIPLTEDSIGYYEADEVLDNSNKTTKLNLIRSIKEQIKFSVYNMALKMGVSNHARFTTSFDFSFIDPEYIVSAKISKVLFAVDTCQVEGESCIVNKGADLTMLDSAYVNLSSSKSSKDFEYELYDEKKFKKLFKRLVKSSQRSISKIKANEKLDEFEFNLVAFKNYDQLKLLKNTNEENDGVFFQGVRNTSTLERLISGLPNYQLVDKVKIHQDGLSLKFTNSEYKNLYLNQLEELRKSNVKDTYMLHIDKNLADAKNFFNNDKFKPLLKDVSLVGNILYIELSDSRFAKDFEKLVDQDSDISLQSFRVLKMDRCSSELCIKPDIEDMNLVPLVKQHSRLDIDTYISVRKLKKIDFKYHGFIEVEAKVKLPL